MKTSITIGPSATAESTLGAAAPTASPSALQNAALLAEMHESTIMSSPSALQNAASQAEMNEQ